MKLFRRCYLRSLSRRAKQERRDNRESEERLVQAEKELVSLRGRAFKVMGLLDDRHRRNHWREAIEQMIQGGV